MVFEESDPESGKVIQWLGDLPLGKVYLTELKNRVERISDHEVKFESSSPHYFLIAFARPRASNMLYF